MKLSHASKGVCSAALACGLVLGLPASALVLDPASAAPIATADADEVELFDTTFDLTVMLENKDNDVVNRNLKGAKWRLHRVVDKDVDKDVKVPDPIEITQADHTDGPLAGSTGIHCQKKLPAGTYRLEFMGIENSELPEDYYVAHQSLKEFKVGPYFDYHVSNVTLREGKNPGYPDDDLCNYFTPSYSADPAGTTFTVAAGKTLKVPAPVNVLGKMPLPEYMRYKSTDIQHPNFVTVNPDGSLVIAPDKLQRPDSYDMMVWAVYPDGSWDRIFCTIRVTDPSEEGDDPVAPLPKVSGKATVVKAGPEGLVAQADVEGLLPYDLPAGFYVGLIERGTELKPGVIPAGAVLVREIPGSGKATAVTKPVDPSMLDRSKHYDLLVWKAHGWPSTELNRAVLPLDITDAQWDSLMAEPEQASWDRLAGDDAFGTMKAITASPQGWPGGSCKTVVLATSSGYWDALAASALAGSQSCPVLLTSPTELPEQTASEIRRLAAEKVVICGGEAAVSAGVEKAVKDLGVATERAQGEDAQMTAIEIAKRVRAQAKPTTCIVATSAGYYDALSVAPWAFESTMPVYLTDASGNLGDAALADMKEAGYTGAIIVGGTAAVSDSTEAKLVSTGIPKADISRLSGDNAWQTSAAIANTQIKADPSRAKCVALADGNGYWDALTGAALVGKNRGVMLLVPHDGPNCAGGTFSYDPFVIDDVVKKNADKIKRAFVFGGEAAVPASTLEAARKAEMSK
ncbi:cell wall-binding repeat-containing protein [Gordonibacter sp. Marseille-P4307]|uniref:cell wall-binding repeat-containing protein n=1 Tax=Gordonibacter sp. Marseille-P4307 TaxID=2161815 RepID=UPI0013DDC63F|nr:cell wall-binding repeat-containing protein [Gordonibacter sp. Marseille-P4307]